MEVQGFCSVNLGVQNVARSSSLGRFQKLRRTLFQKVTQTMIQMGCRRHCLYPPSFDNVSQRESILPAMTMTILNPYLTPTPAFAGLTKKLGR
jgi:hypothetical protein